MLTMGSVKSSSNWAASGGPEIEFTVLYQTSYELAPEIGAQVTSISPFPPVIFVIAGSSGMPSGSGINEVTKSCHIK